MFPGNWWLHAMSLPTAFLQKKKQIFPVTSMELQELETAYAEALGDGADAQTLAALWKEIRRCKSETGQYA